MLVTIQNYTRGKKPETCNTFKQHKTIILIFYKIHFSQDSSIQN